MKNAHVVLSIKPMPSFNAFFNQFAQGFHPSISLPTQHILHVSGEFSYDDLLIINMSTKQIENNVWHIYLPTSNVWYPNLGMCNIMVSSTMEVPIINLCFEGVPIHQCSITQCDEELVPAWPCINQPIVEPISIHGPSLVSNWQFVKLIHRPHINYFWPIIYMGSFVQ
jgi:hypothetical protein